ncbi:MAG TPA: hypothetical protein VG367_17765 [Mucilaginibacter sp.]|jgi:hypothetical protein|nr:hypothetical protein [Mucilaginibacter sp.]
MLSEKQNLPRIVNAAIFTIVVILGVMLYIAPPSIFPDPANGFQVMRSMEMGGPFNHLVAPAQDDIAKNTSEFLTWWSPGQYLLPYAFKLLFGVNTGQASVLTILLCQLIGLAGLLAFFKKAGFSPLVSSLSLLFIACQQFFVVPYVFYNGGETLFFAFVGWFLYGCLSIKNPGWQLILFVLLSGWVGFFCKSSMLWMFGAGLLFLWIRLSSKKDMREWIKNGIWIAIPAVISVATIYLFYLSKGQNPSSATNGLKFTWKTLTFPLASPLLSGFSVDDLAHGLIYHTGKPYFSNTVAIIILLALAILSVWLICRILNRVTNENYRMLIKVFYIISILFFGYAYLRQMSISYEARHFRIIGLLVIPGTIYLIQKSASAYKGIFTLIWVGIAVTSIVYMAKGYAYNKDKSAHGVSGIAQQTIDQKSLDQVMALDRQNTNAIFVFVGESLGLEIKHNRVISLQPIGDNLKIDFDDYEFDGHAGPLYIILSESYAGPKEKFILKAFPDYHGWYGSMLSDNYVMYAAK